MTVEINLQYLVWKQENQLCFYYKVHYVFCSYFYLFLYGEPLYAKVSDRKKETWTITSPKLKSFGLLRSIIAHSK